MPMLDDLGKSSCPNLPLDGLPDVTRVSRSLEPFVREVN